MNREEIYGAMKAFGKDQYTRTEILSELFALQNEMVRIAFPDNNSDIDSLKTWDIERYLNQLNKERGGVATEELCRFRNDSREFSNTIKAEISGRKGEKIAFDSFRYIFSPNIILKNVELSDDKLNTEIDAVVITPKGITVVEVKNTSKNIYISPKGNYYTTGEYNRQDCKIGEKIDLKERLLRNALRDAGIDGVPIRSVVVFTNSKIEVQNRYEGIKTCFVDQLPDMIDGYMSDLNMNEKEMEKIGEVIKQANCPRKYPARFDVIQFKNDFADLMLKLSSAPEYREPVVKYNIWSYIKRLLTTRYSARLGTLAATFAIITKH